VVRLTRADGQPLFSLRRDPSISRPFGEAVLGRLRAARFDALGEAISDPAAYDVGAWINRAAGALLLIADACCRAVGAWDGSFFLYGDETDYCQRARQAAFGVRCVPSPSAVHLDGNLDHSARATTTTTTNLIHSKLRLYPRHQSAVTTAVYRVPPTLDEDTGIATGSRVHRAGLAVALTWREEGPLVERDFLFFSAQDYWYHNRGHSDIQIARRIAQSRRVLLVNSIGMRMPVPGKTTQAARRILRKLRSVAHGIRQPESDLPNLYVMSPITLPLYGSRHLRAVNAALVRWQVQRALRRLRMLQPHIVVTVPTAWDVISPMSRSSLIVNRSDKYSSYGEANTAAMAQLESKLLTHADAAVYVSHRLLEEERHSLLNGEAHFLGHGVDYAHFAKATQDDSPEDLRSIRSPRIGFFGGIDDYVIDFGLLEKVAKEIPDASLVLIGAATSDMTALTSHPNVYWLGSRPYEEIPRYGAGFDVAIMPWLQNEWIANCNPIKTKEYLALGVPVVSTYYPESDYVDDVIAVAMDHQEFVSYVRAALAGHGVSTEKQRRERVRGDSWELRSELLLRLADSAVESTGRH
jgi:glycosyltransferase involved in cell wall biosynthesis